LSRLLRKRGSTPRVVAEYPDELRDCGLIEPARPFRLLFSAYNGKATVSEGRQRYSLDLGPAEPMLSRVTDPRLHDSYRFRNTILGWSFYSGLHVDRAAAIRLPQPPEASTTLGESGENLTSVLLPLFTNLDYEEQRDELLSFLHAAIPHFEILTPTPEAISNRVVLQWVEEDVKAKLSATDLSDGVLRVLALGVICCNPHPPSLICIDEPEIGLHPKLMPLVGGLLRQAALRSQVIVLTHSPEFLYAMPIESIAVMSRRDGEAKIVWPRKHDLLYDLLTEEVAGERDIDRDRLHRSFISGEIDELA
jgi:predicted ATPase